MNLTVNGRSIVLEPGITVLDAARSIGVKVPTMCHLDGYNHFTSCMICVVKDKTSGRLLPSCSAPAADGMVIETDSEEVRQARKSALDLLLSEHVGDCEAPCRMACPAHMNIPLMIRQLGAGKTRDAIETIKEAIALPAVLGRICHAPCQNACRRGRFDSPLAICLLKRFAADVDLSGHAAYEPACSPPSGRRVAIVGAGPAGLAAAYHLARAGHACTVIDDREEPGGQLRYGVPDNVLPREVLGKEVDAIRKLGVVFRMKTRVGREIEMSRLREEFDAIVLAPGKQDVNGVAAWGVEANDNRIRVDQHSLVTSEAGVFAGGEAIHDGHLAVRAVAHGKTMACAADQYLRGTAVTGPVRRFESRMGRLLEGEILEFMKEGDPSTGIEPVGGATTGFSAEEAVKECGRCMHCDCRKGDSCRLRELSGEYQASQKHFNVNGRRRFTRITTHSAVVYEPGKCTKCGICVRITGRAREALGMTFLGRGFEARVGVPFDESLGAGLANTAVECVKQCPTGALALRNNT